MRSTELWIEAKKPYFQGEKEKHLLIVVTLEIPLDHSAPHICHLSQRAGTVFQLGQARIDGGIYLRSKLFSCSLDLAPTLHDH